MTVNSPLLLVHVPRLWLRLLHIGEPLIAARWGAGGSFTFQPVESENSRNASLVLGEAQFPDKILSAFWTGSKRAAICPRYRPNTAMAD